MKKVSSMDRDIKQTFLLKQNGHSVKRCYFVSNWISLLVRQIVSTSAWKSHYCCSTDSAIVCKSIKFIHFQVNKTITDPCTVKSDRLIHSTLWNTSFISLIWFLLVLLIRCSTILVQECNSIQVCINYIDNIVVWRGSATFFIFWNSKVFFCNRNAVNC